MRKVRREVTRKFIWAAVVWRAERRELPAIELGEGSVRCMIATIHLPPGNPPPGHNVGDPISPPTGYTVPSAGSEVLLHNGQPLYGLPPAPSCLIPMMRQTAVVIDQAGNIWSINNWKPDFDTDTQGGNPGGDGIIIFVGLAPPPYHQVH